MSLYDNSTELSLVSDFSSPELFIFNEIMTITSLLCRSACAIGNNKSENPPAMYM